MKKSWLVAVGALLAIATITLFAFDSPEKATRLANTPNSIKSPFTPEKLVFANEEVPLQDFDVRERFDRELMINTFWHSQTMYMLKKTNRFLPRMEAILKKNGVPDDFKYLAMAESGLANVVSSAKAEGFWQFLEPTGKKYGLEINEEVDERYHLDKATEAAAKFLKESKNTLGNWTLAAAAYNMGCAGVNNCISNQGVKNYYDLLLNTETSRYMFRILAIKEIHKNAAGYGFALDSTDYYPVIETYTVKVDTAIDNLAKFALDQGVNYKVLKLLNPWLRKPYLKNKARKTYYIELPKDKSFIKNAMPVEPLTEPAIPPVEDENVE